MAALTIKVDSKKSLLIVDQLFIESITHPTEPIVHDSDWFGLPVDHKIKYSLTCVKQSINRVSLLIKLCLGQGSMTRDHFELFLVNDKNDKQQLTNIRFEENYFCSFNVMLTNELNNWINDDGSFRFRCDFKNGIEFEVPKSTPKMRPKVQAVMAAANMVEMAMKRHGVKGNKQVTETENITVDRQPSNRTSDESAPRSPIIGESSNLLDNNIAKAKPRRTVRRQKKPITPGSVIIMEPSAPSWPGETLIGSIVHVNEKTDQDQTVVKPIQNQNVTLASEQSDEGPRIPTPLPRRSAIDSSKSSSISMASCSTDISFDSPKIERNSNRDSFTSIAMRFTSTFEPDGVKQSGNQMSPISSNDDPYESAVESLKMSQIVSDHTSSFVWTRSPPGLANRDLRQHLMSALDQQPIRYPNLEVLAPKIPDRANYQRASGVSRQSVVVEESNQLTLKQKALMMMFENQKQSLKNKKLANVTFRVDRDRLQVAKFILCAHSDTFNQIFKKDPQLDVIRLTDINLETIDKLVNTLYTGQLVIKDTDDAICLLKAANRYKIGFIKRQSENYLNRNISIDNVCKFLQLSIELNCNSLKESVLSFFKNRKSNTLQGLKFEKLADYSSLDKHHLTMIVNSLLE